MLSLYGLLTAIRQGDPKGFLQRDQKGVHGPRESFGNLGSGIGGGGFARQAAHPGFGTRRVPAPPCPQMPASVQYQTDWRRSSHPVARRWLAACLRMEQAAARWLRVHDLAQDIGSRHWLHGAATCATLAAAALALWPSFSPLQAAPLQTLDDGMADELAAQGIRPLAQGAGNGRHFAATPRVVHLAAAPERPSIAMTATLGANDSLARMLQRSGLADSDAAQVAGLITRAMPPDQLVPGTRFQMTLGAHANPLDSRPLEKLSVRARFDLAIDIVRQGGALALHQRAIPVETAPLRLSGIVGSSLYRSARAAGVSPQAVQDYLRTIDTVLPFEDIAPSDEFDIVVSYKRAADGQGEMGDLLYAGVQRAGQPRAQLLRWGSQGEFMSPEAMKGTMEGAASSGLLAAPVEGHITSGFGLRRHPILGYVRMHAGIDFGAAWGAPIHAVSDGTVSFAGWHGGHGEYVRLDHGGGIGTGYGHMSRIAVSPGSHVVRGQVIGYVGSTGLSTGPHLHYELYRGGQVVDPSSISMIARTRSVDPAQLAAYRARLAAFMALRPGAPR